MVFDVSGKRGSEASEAGSFMSPRSSFAAAEGSPPQAKAGTVVTSSRASKRRSVLLYFNLPSFSPRLRRIVLFLI